MKTTHLINLVIQCDNPLQQPQYGAPVLMTTATVITDAVGQPMYQPAFMNMPASEQDISDEVLNLLKEKLAVIGLSVDRITSQE